jgi:hypothetical protein
MAVESATDLRPSMSAQSTGNDEADVRQPGIALVFHWVPALPHGHRGVSPSRGSATG